MIKKSIILVLIFSFLFPNFTGVNLIKEIRADEFDEGIQLEKEIEDFYKQKEIELVEYINFYKSIENEAKEEVGEESYERQSLYLISKMWDQKIESNSIPDKFNLDKYLELNEEEKENLVNYFIMNLKFLAVRSAEDMAFSFDNGEAIPPALTENNKIYSAFVKDVRKSEIYSKILKLEELKIKEFEGIINGEISDFKLNTDFIGKEKQFRENFEIKIKANFSPNMNHFKIEPCDYLFNDSNTEIFFDREERFYYNDLDNLLEYYTSLQDELLSNLTEEERKAKEFLIKEEVKKIREFAQKENIKFIDFYKSEFPSRFSKLLFRFEKVVVNTKEEIDFVPSPENPKYFPLENNQYTDTSFHFDFSSPYYNKFKEVFNGDSYITKEIKEKILHSVLYKGVYESDFNITKENGELIYRYKNFSASYNDPKYIKLYFDGKKNGLKIEMEDFSTVSTLRKNLFREGKFNIELEQKNFSQKENSDKFLSLNFLNYPFTGKSNFGVQIYLNLGVRQNYKFEFEIKRKDLKAELERLYKIKEYDFNLEMSNSEYVRKLDEISARPELENLYENIRRMHYDEGMTDEYFEALSDEFKIFTLLYYRHITFFSDGDSFGPRWMADYALYLFRVLNDSNVPSIQIEYHKKLISDVSLGKYIPYEFRHLDNFDEEDFFVYNGQGYTEEEVRQISEIYNALDKELVDLVRPSDIGSTNTFYVAIEDSDVCRGCEIGRFHYIEDEDIKEFEQEFRDKIESKQILIYKMDESLKSTKFTKSFLELKDNKIQYKGLRGFPLYPKNLKIDFDNLTEEEYQFILKMEQLNIYAQYLKEMIGAKNSNEKIPTILFYSKFRVFKSDDVLRLIYRDFVKRPEYFCKDNTEESCSYIPTTKEIQDFYSKTLNLIKEIETNFNILKMKEKEDFTINYKVYALNSERRDTLDSIFYGRLQPIFYKNKVNKNLVFNLKVESDKTYKELFLKFYKNMKQIKGSNIYFKGNFANTIVNDLLESSFYFGVNPLQLSKINTENMTTISNIYPYQNINIEKINENEKNHFLIELNRAKNNEIPVFYNFGIINKDKAIFQSKNLILTNSNEDWLRKQKILLPSMSFAEGIEIDNEIGFVNEPIDKQIENLNKEIERLSKEEDVDISYEKRGYLIYLMMKLERLTNYSNDNLIHIKKESLINKNMSWDGEYELPSSYFSEKTTEIDITDNVSPKVKGLKFFVTGESFSQFEEFKAQPVNGLKDIQFASLDDVESLKILRDFFKKSIPNTGDLSSSGVKIRVKGTPKQTLPKTPFILDLSNEVFGGLQGVYNLGNFIEVRSIEDIVNDVNKDLGTKITLDKVKIEDVDKDIFKKTEIAWTEIGPSQPVPTPKQSIPWTELEPSTPIKKDDITPPQAPQTNDNNEAVEIIKKEEKVAENNDKQSEATKKDYSLLRGKILENIKDNIVDKLPKVYQDRYLKHLDNYRQDYKYFRGYPDNSMKPEQIISRQELAEVLNRILFEDDKTQSFQILDKFIDEIPTWSAPAIANFVSKGIYIDDESFSPNKMIDKIYFNQIKNLILKILR